MDLTAVADFNPVTRHGGFGAASRATGQSKATLSRRVRELDTALGVRLIDRNVRALRLTDEGATLHVRTDAPFAVTADALQDIKSGLNRPSGRLRVSATLLLATQSPGPLAAAFIRTYPEVQLEVTTDDTFVDLRDGDFDIAIRANPRPDDDLVGRWFLRNPLVLAAPPGMARPIDPAQAFPAVMRLLDAGTWTVVDAQDGTTHSWHPAAVLRLSSPVSIRDAVLAGAGAGLVPLPVAAADLDAGRLVSWGMSTSPPVEAWVLHALRRLASPKVTGLMQFICDDFASPSSA
jgi:DNA-binding transcriptional LysR family regulator